MDKNLEKIDHIVVLMMENRSFDHMLGFLTIESGRVFPRLVEFLTKLPGTHLPTLMVGLAFAGH